MRSVRSHGATLGQKIIVYLMFSKCNELLNNGLITLRKIFEVNIIQININLISSSSSSFIFKNHLLFSTKLGLN